VTSKKPLAAFSPKTEKVPRQGEHPNLIWSEKPSWRLQQITLADDAPFSWRHLESDDFPKVLKRLQAFESMTWGEINRQKSSHSMPAYQVSAAARDHLEALGLGDTEQLYQLQVTGSARIWGVRVGATLALLWWDPDHLVYPVSKKGT
jgi:hypothetical protein